MGALTTFAAVVAALDTAGVPCALIGGLALGAHGHARATRDADLLADRRALEPRVWAGLAAATVDIRRGEPEDPLLGVVRIRKRGGPATDVIVVGAWAAPILERAVGPIRVRGAGVRVATAADLVLLKLYAGGPKDLADVRLLLAAEPDLARQVEAALPRCPEACRETWERLR